MTEIDWQKICLDLRSCYKPISQYCREVGSDWRHVNRLARGEVDQPRFSVGMKLLDMHHQHCPGRRVGKFVFMRGEKA